MQPEELCETSHPQANRTENRTNILLTTTSISGEISCGYETHSKYMERPLARSPETSETAKPHASYSTSIRNWSSRREKIIPCLTNHLWGPQKWNERNKSPFIILGILYQLLQGQREKVLTHIAFSQCNSCPRYRQLTSPRLWTLAPSSLNCADQLRSTF